MLWLQPVRHSLIGHASKPHRVNRRNVDCGALSSRNSPWCI